MYTLNIGNIGENLPFSQICVNIECDELFTVAEKLKKCGDSFPPKWMKVCAVLEIICKNFDSDL